MKTIAKRLFATVLALALMCTMVTGFAANTASVETIKIYDNGEAVKTYDSTTTFDNIEVTEGQLIEVTAKLTDAEMNALEEGDLTFLSRIVSEAGLSNNTIHYVAQATVNANGKATFTFRPRTSVGFGVAVANVGGTDVEEAETFSYDVKKAIVTLNLKADGATSIQENDTTTNIAFTLENYASGDLTVELGEDALEKDVEYTIDGTTLTILNKAIPKDVDNYTLKVTGTGYTEATATISVTKKSVTPDDPIEDEEQSDNAQDVVNGLDFAIVDNKVILETEVNIAPEGEEEFIVQLTNAVDTKNDPALSYDVVSGVIEYTPGIEDAPFVSKATVTVSVTSTPEINKTETIYFIHPNTTEIAFGNVTAIAAADGTDAFAKKETFENLITNNKTELLATRAQALNVVLGRKANIVSNDTIDYDGDTTITLNEYRIFKLMLDNDAENHPVFLFENVMSQRDHYKVSE